MTEPKDAKFTESNNSIQTETTHPAPKKDQCPLCDTLLEISFKCHMDQGSIEELAFCPTCRVAARSLSFQLH